jgi:hypothetical protein
MAQPPASGARRREPALLAVAIYGGYFNGDWASLMALYTVAGEQAQRQCLREPRSLVLSWLSVAAFVIAGRCWREGC